MNVARTAYVLGPFYTLLPRRWRAGARHGAERSLVRATIISGVGPRPYVYSLRQLPAGEVARGLKNYDPSDVLRPVERIQPI